MVRRSVHLTNAWHPTSGGVRTFYEALLQGANRHQRHVSLIVPGDKTMCERRGEYGRIYFIKADRSPFFDRRYRVLWPHRYLRVRRSALWRILAREQPDLIEICDKYTLPWLAGMMRRRAGDGPRPTLVGHSAERMDDNVAVWVGGGRVTAALTRAYLRRIYVPFFDAHVTNSDYTAGELRDVIVQGREADPRLRRLDGRVFVGPMGVDVGGFGRDRRSEDCRRALAALCGGSESSLLLAYAGRLSPEKNVDIFPDLLRDLTARGHDARLVICGDGPARGRLQADAERVAPGRLHVLGHIDRVQLATALASADLFVHPNPKEPFGIGPLEAMASAIPVVVPDSGGVLMYASNDNAWLAPATGTAFAATIDDLLQRPLMTAQRVEQGLKTVRMMAWPDAIDRYFDHYDRIDALRRQDALQFSPSSNAVVAASLHALPKIAKLDGTFTRPPESERGNDDSVEDGVEPCGGRGDDQRRRRLRAQ